ncbi:AAA+ ATPase domain [Arabidopsis thaliana x Arabidopsis arenosa]|uniref:AAA+ ATPase domain n=1 Tax=Arabidopsis thaliana x Arabidopsis arenosa TaxID=1240361 RepID=A0A8T2C2V9_9BRAS|nr:AAA+ ATPase domain [Arabidopsis thaliana x Arabidopsis arenosa]
MERMIVWVAPEDGWSKMNTDGASQGNPGLATAGGVLRNSAREWCGGFTLNIGRCSALLAELWGVYYGLYTAWEHRVTRLVLEVDSSLLVGFLTTEIGDSHPLSFLVRFCHAFISRDWIVQVTHVYREANRLADGLANYAFSLPLGFHAFVSVPIVVDSILRDDVVGTTVPRPIRMEDEAAMIEKIVMDVSKKLDVTLSRDFEWMVGMEAHLKKLNSILCLEYDKVKMIGIWGPAGIGKTTIARALYDQLSGSFPFICFMGELKGSYTSIMGVDEHDSKLLLQNKLLSKILNRSDMSVNHLGAIKEWLHDKRVFIILDDVDDLEKLETLAKERTWFGLGSRIIVTTEDKKILKAHGINDIYHVDFPSEKEALEILCLSAFKQSYVQDGFEELANKVAEFCGNLPLGLCIVGSSLRGESKDEWELQLSRIETSLDRKVEDILRVGYDRLSDKAQSLFLHITCFFFDGKDVDYVTAMLADTTLDVKNGLKILAEKSLIYISFHGLIGMHYLLQQLGKQIVLQQSNEPGKRQFLVEFEEIRDVLKNETGTGSVIGISFDMYKIGKLFISKGAFKGMRNLKFLRIYNGKVTLLEDMEYLPHLRLLHWDTYPRKSLPPTFDPELLVELHMPNSNLEKLWGGIQPLANLMKIDLTLSSNLKEIPNLSKATSLETLQLSSCKSLLELPSSISNLHKLKKLSVRGCYALEVIPTNINLALLEEVDMGYCSSLRTFPDLSSNIYRLDVSSTKIEDVPSPVVGRWSPSSRVSYRQKLPKAGVNSRSCPFARVSKCKQLSITQESLSIFLQPNKRTHVLQLFGPG